MTRFRHEPELNIKRIPAMIIQVEMPNHQTPATFASVLQHVTDVDWVHFTSSGRNVEFVVIPHSALDQKQFNRVRTKLEGVIKSTIGKAWQPAFTLKNVVVLTIWGVALPIENTTRAGVAIEALTSRLRPKINQAFTVEAGKGSPLIIVVPSSDVQLTQLEWDIRELLIETLNT